MAASCARRSLAADTIFMALVIFCVFFTEVMRFRMLFKVAMRLRQFADGTWLTR
ncbi:MAG: hypothetical protein ACE5I7_20075 [Candidatus Binatia bacterium]